MNIPRSQELLNCANWNAAEAKRAFDESQKRGSLEVPYLKRHHRRLSQQAADLYEQALAAARAERHP